MTTITQQDLARASDFPTYLKMVRTLWEEGKSTGPTQSESLLHYSGLNLRRMDRVIKKLELSEDSQRAMDNIQEPQVWVVLTEGWCGDAAQTLPIMYRLAEASAKVELKVLLRDENLPIMDQYLTDGGRGIPKLVILRASDLQELAVWGPRPAGGQELLKAYKSGAMTHDEFVKQLQLWYNKDKGQSTQSEISALLNQINLVQV
jgi:hypothetical protein